MSGTGEEAFISAIKLHVTANLAIIRAAEEELIKNKVGMHMARHSPGKACRQADAPALRNASMRQCVTQLQLDDVALVIGRQVSNLHEGPAFQRHVSKDVR